MQNLKIRKLKIRSESANLYLQYDVTTSAESYFNQGNDSNKIEVENSSFTVEPGLDGTVAIDSHPMFGIIYIVICVCNTVCPTEGAEKFIFQL